MARLLSEYHCSSKWMRNSCFAEARGYGDRPPCLLAWSRETNQSDQRQPRRNRLRLSYVAWCASWPYSACNRNSRADYQSSIQSWPGITGALWCGSRGFPRASSTKGTCHWQDEIHNIPQCVLQISGFEGQAVSSREGVRSKVTCGMPPKLIF